MSLYEREFFQFSEVYIPYRTRRKMDAYHHEILNTGKYKEEEEC